MLTVERIDPGQAIRPQDSAEIQNSLLSCCLSKRVAELVAEFEQDGKLPDDWREQCDRFSAQAFERGELLIYPDWKTEKERLKIEELFQGLSFAVACLAFVPGGISIFGVHYTASFDHGCSEA